MKDHEGDIKEFYHLSRAWYGKSNLANSTAGYVDRVTFGFYCPDGGTSGELSMVWYELSSGKPAARLECFEDAFHTLAQFKDMIDRLAEADDEKITPAEFCQILLDCGFVDATPTKDPYKNERAEIAKQARRKLTPAEIAVLGI